MSFRITQKLFKDFTVNNQNTLQDLVLPLVEINPSVGTLPLGDIFLNISNQTIYYKGSATILSPLVTSSAFSYQNTIGGPGTSFYINSVPTVLSPFGDNTIVGVGSGNAALVGTDNSFYGFDSGQNDTSGSRNAFFGSKSGQNDTTGSDNTFIGYQSGQNNTIGSDNTFVGSQSGKNNQANENTYIGFNAGLNSTTAMQGAFLGSRAGLGVTTGNFSVAIGLLAMGAGPVTGNSNVCVGGIAGQFITTGNGNTFLGDSAGSVNIVDSDFNTLVGFQAGRLLGPTSQQNTFVGRTTGNIFVTGNDNTFIGHQAGLNMITGSNNTALGAGTIIFNTLSFATAIGANAFNSQSNSIKLGRDGVDQVFCGSSISVNTIQLTDGNSHIVSGGATPGIAAGTGAGAGSAINISGTDLSGNITLTTGAAPAASATIFTVTFNLAYGLAPEVLVSPKDVNSASLSGTSNPFVSATTTTTFTFTSNTVALAAATTYIWSYMVMH